MEVGCPRAPKWLATFVQTQTFNPPQSAEGAIAIRNSSMFIASVMSGCVLPQVGVLSAVMGIWRLSADPGWASNFFIADGLLSHYQVWIAIAVGAQASVFILNRWLANQTINLRTLSIHRSTAP